MRCPECTQRNSVAARKCMFCGRRFKRKNSPAPFIAGAAVVAIVLIGVLVAAILPLFRSGTPDLDTLGDKMAQGPKSAEEAQTMKSQLDECLMQFLVKHGHLPSSDLLTKLQSQLPTSTFEVLVFDLPHQVKLVEVDCVLQPSDYLIVNSKSGPKPFRLSGLSVFDEARLISDKTGEYLVLLGHTSGGGDSSPQLKVLSIGPDNTLADKTDSVSPRVSGEGAAQFDGKSSAIKLTRSFVSAARGERLMVGELPAPIKDEQFTTLMHWKNGKYEASYTLGDSRIAALYSVASCLVAPTEVEKFKPFLAENVQSSLTSLAANPAPSGPEFRVSADAASAPRKPKGPPIEYFRLSSGNRSFQVGLVGPNRKATKWTVTNLEEKGAPPAVAKADEKSSAVNDSAAESIVDNLAPEVRQNETISAVETDNSVAKTDSIRPATPKERIRSKAAETRKLAEATRDDSDKKRVERRSSVEASERKLAERKSEEKSANRKSRDSNDSKVAERKSRDSNDKKVADRKSNDSDKKIADRKSTGDDKKVADRKSKDSDKKVADRKSTENDKKLAKATDYNDKKTGKPTDDKKVANQKKGNESVDKRLAELKPAIADDNAYVATKNERHAPEAKTDVKGGGPAYISQQLNSTVTVRSGPGTKFTSVTTTTKGTPVQVLGKNGGWYQVSVNGKKGYVYGGLVDYKKNDALLTAVVKKEKHVKHTDSGKHITTTTPGDKLVVVGGLENNKYKVRLANGNLGYVDKDAIDVAIDEPAFVP